MGILDWFINRQSHFDPKNVSSAQVDASIEKAVTLVNPKLKLLSSYKDRLRPAVECSLRFLQDSVNNFPKPITLSEAIWSSSPELKAFFAAAGDIPQSLGRSNNVRTFLGKFQELEEVCLILDMKFDEFQTNSLSLQVDQSRQDMTQTFLSFSDYKTRICGKDESEVHSLFGAQGFEYFVAQALSEIAENRTERRILEEQRSILRARLRLFQQQGPGLGSVFNAAPQKTDQVLELEKQLMENDRQMEAIGTTQVVLEDELARLCDVLANPHRYARFERVTRCVDSMNGVVENTSIPNSFEVNFSVVNLMGEPLAKRAFILANFPRSELPAQAVNFENAAKLL